VGCSGADEMNESATGAASLCMLGAMVAGYPAPAQRPATVVGPRRTPVSSTIAAEPQPRKDRTHNPYIAIIGAERAGAVVTATRIR
jgi:hypothetical protein